MRNGVAYEHLDLNRRGFDAALTAAERASYFGDDFNGSGSRRSVPGSTGRLRSFAEMRKRAPNPRGRREKPGSAGSCAAAFDFCVDRLYRVAGRGLEQRRDEGVDEGGGAGAEQPGAESDGKRHMLRIGLADAGRMIAE